MVTFGLFASSSNERWGLLRGAGRKGRGQKMTMVSICIEAGI